MPRAEVERGFFMEAQCEVSLVPERHIKALLVILLDPALGMDNHWSKQLRRLGDVFGISDHTASVKGQSSPNQNAISESLKPMTSHFLQIAFTHSLHLPRT